MYRYQEEIVQQIQEGKLNVIKYLVKRDLQEERQLRLAETIANTEDGNSEWVTIDKSILDVTRHPMYKGNGICAICKRELTDPESVARGIGPVCIRKVFAPHFHEYNLHRFLAPKTLRIKRKPLRSGKAIQAIMLDNPKTIIFPISAVFHIAPPGQKLGYIYVQSWFVDDFKKRTGITKEV